MLDQRHVDIISAENYICYHGAFSYHHYSHPDQLLPVSCSAPLRSEPSNAAADGARWMPTLRKV